MEPGERDIWRAGTALLEFWREARAGDLSPLEKILRQGPRTPQETILRGKPRSNGSRQTDARAPAHRADPAPPPPRRASAPKPAPAVSPANPGVLIHPDILAAREIAQSAQTIQELDRALRDFDLCALKRTARNTVFLAGQQDAPILWIGDSPDKEDDENGQPFSGKSGRFLDQMLRQIGLERQRNIMLTNMIFWRSPGARDPSEHEIRLCWPFVERLTRLAKPKLIVLCGGRVAQTMLQRSESLTKLRGKKFISSWGASGEEAEMKIPTFVTLPPAQFLLRPQDKALGWRDLLALESLLREEHAVEAATDERDQDD